MKVTNDLTFYMSDLCMTRKLNVKDDTMHNLLIDEMELYMNTISIFVKE